MINETVSDRATSSSSITATTGTSAPRSEWIGLVHVSACSSGAYFDEGAAIRAAERHEANKH